MESRRRRERIQRTRAYRAAVMVITFCCAIAFLLGAQQGHAADVLQDSTTREVWESMGRGEELFDVLERTGFARASPDTFPDWFSAEIVSPEDELDVMANKEWSLAYLECNRSRDDAISWFDGTLRERNWKRFETGVSGAEIYQKESGVCSWLMAQYTQAGQKTSIVLHILHV